MKKKLIILIALVFAFAFALSACGDAGTEETASPEKVTATATMNAGDVPVEVTIDTSQGYSVIFADDGFSLFEGEYDDSTYPLVTATILSQEIYDKYLADNKDNETLQEVDGFTKYTSSIGELACLWKIGDKVPFLMTFEKSVDGDRADEIIGCMEMSAVE